MPCAKCGWFYRLKAGEVQAAREAARAVKQEEQRKKQQYGAAAPWRLPLVDVSAPGQISWHRGFPGAGLFPAVDRTPLSLLWLAGALRCRSGAQWGMRATTWFHAVPRAIA